MTGWAVPQLWKAERAFIIAGGPSVGPERIAKIRGRIIAIKHAVTLRPDADILFWAGHDWHRSNAGLVASHRGEFLVKRKVEESVPGWIKQVERANPDADGLSGLASDRRRLGGLCSGGSALNLAVHLGAAEIVLVGFDFTGRHWCKDHPAPIATEAQHARHRASIEKMAAPITALGVAVFNCSPISTLQGFARRDLEEFT